MMLTPFSACVIKLQLRIDVNELIINEPGASPAGAVRIFFDAYGNPVCCALLVQA
tara:strand:+ start:2552 stop:2716 length:165 start_codon:yes stop_codon:yes gene_type:complete